MLALTRRIGEEVIIGDPNEPLGVIRVVEIHGDKVRLSFDFPRSVMINRKELAEQKAKFGSIPKPGAPGAPAAPPNTSGAPDAPSSPGSPGSSGGPDASDSK